jgi:hypothetical protein
MKFKSNSNSFQSYESAGELLPPFLLSFLFCPNFPKMFCLLVTLVTLVAMANLVHGQSCAAMSQLERIGRSRSAGRRPDGRCYFHVSYMLEDARYGNFAPGNFLQYVPAGFIAEAYQFAQWMNTGNNARLAGLQRMKLDDVAKAPAGAIVVVRAGTCGTAHPTAGDIAISSGDGVSFWNGGDMRYCQSFRPGNNFVLGIYQPLECSADAGGDGGEACHTCILHGGGAGCSDQHAVRRHVHGVLDERRRPRLLGTLLRRQGAGQVHGERQRGHVQKDDVVQGQRSAVFRGREGLRTAARGRDVLRGPVDAAVCRRQHAL